MTNEQLMQPRYEVIADYPNSKFEVGSIFNQHFFETSIYGNYIYVTDTESPLQGGILKKEFAETMPHLFRKLEWWEKRDVKDMPQYVKCVKTPDQIHFADTVYKMDNTIILSTNCYIPSTETEFLTELNKEK